MPGDWIKMRVDIHDQPEVIGIARRNRLNADTVVGKLIRIWGWANRVTEDGRIPHVDRDYIDKLAQRKGFADAMVFVGWLSEDGEQVVIPHFDRHNSDSAKARAMDTERKRAARIASENCPGTSRTNGGPEKRREEREKKRPIQTQDPPPPQETGIDAIAIPECLDTHEVRLAWAEFKQHRREKKKPVTPTSVKNLFAEFSDRGPVRFAAALRHSMANGWVGVFEPDGVKAGDKNGKPKRESMRFDPVRDAGK